MSIPPNWPRNRLLLALPSRAEETPRQGFMAADNFALSTGAENCVHQLNLIVETLRWRRPANAGEGPHRSPIVGGNESPPGSPCAIEALASLTQIVVPAPRNQDVVIPLVKLFPSFIYALAALSLAVFFYVFSKSQN